MLASSDTGRGISENLGRGSLVCSRAKGPTRARNPLPNKTDWIRWICSTCLLCFQENLATSKQAHCHSFASASRYRL